MNCPKCDGTDYTGPDDFDYYSCRHCYFEWKDEK